DRLELAAAEFTLAEFVGMGAFVESIGSLSGSATEIGSVIQRHWQQARDTTRRAWRDTWRNKQKRSLHGLLSVSADCALDGFDHYADGMKEIAAILHRTRRQITEPYVTRLELFNEIEQEMENRPL